MNKLLVLGGLVLAGCAKPEPTAEATPAAAGDKPDAPRGPVPGGDVATASFLTDESAEVRRAAVIAVGSAPRGQAAAGPDDDLFPRLHDADKEVRELAASALRGRGLTDIQLHLARQLASPDVADRLKLLVDLADGDGVADVGPWLERLSRDPEPAVRLGAARLACECRVVFAGWLDRLADGDPDPLVRQGATYWRAQVRSPKR